MVESASGSLLGTVDAGTAPATVLTLGTTPSYRVVKLHAPVLSAFPAADGANAVVLHADETPAGTGGSTGAGGGSQADAGAPAPRVGRAFR